MKKLLKWIGTLSLAGFLAACGGGSTNGNIAEVAQKDGFSALLLAANKAGLSATLSTGSNLTVFAPTDAAFTQLATTLGFSDAAAMVNALPADVLAKILEYHVLPSVKYAADLSNGGPTQATVYNFSGAAATVGVSATNGVTLTDADLTTAHVVQANVPADNGVIHAIDKVLVPPGVLNIVQMAQLNPAFSSLVGAVVSTNLTGALSGPGPFTVFAPVNAAFAAAPSGLTTAQLTSVLLYHVIPAQVLSTQIPFGTPVATLDTTSLAGATVPAETITINSNLTITDTTAAPAGIVATDVRASNGVIHVIDKVLIPN